MISTLLWKQAAIPSDRKKKINRFSNKNRTAHIRILIANACRMAEA